MTRSSPCPCTSGKKYGECCAPFHEGAREPQEPVEVVRSRYSAFALGKIDYLVKTLHADHPDRAKPPEALVFALRTASSSFKYMGLTVVESRPADADGVSRALYLARIFRKGQDVSFVELAEFMHDGTGLRYRAGKTMEASGMKTPPPDLSIDTFRAS